jgi:Pectate lyase
MKLFVPSLALCFAGCSALLAPSIFAQGYPKVPADIKAVEDTRKAAVAKLSDEAWARALPEVNAWAAKGKPYIPGAAKPEDLPQAKIPAFPGAWGGGMYSFGGRGGRIIVVTTLADSGPGSLREACEAGGPRIVVFNVSGIIQLKTRISVRAPYITIAGNTAPGDGVCIAGDTFELNTHDIIVRHMRFRRGKTDPADRDDSFGGNPVGNLVIDHVSSSWSLDENISMYRHMYQPPGSSTALKLPTVNVTIQNSISSESLNIFHHSFGSTIGGLNSTFHHNLWANNTGRNPSIGMYGDFTFVNNVLFNYHHRTVDGGDHLSLYNIFNNYFKPGPGTPKDDVAYRILKPESERNKTVKDHFGKAYVNGNVVEGYENVTKDNWDGGVQPEVREKSLASVLTGIRVDTPFPHAPLPTTTALVAYDYVVANAGATLPRRDPVDERIITMVQTGIPAKAVIAKGSAEKAAFYGYEAKWTKQLADSVTKGYITDPSEVGGYPNYQGIPYVDSDHDGLPDDWETAHGLNPKDASDATTDLNGDGYTNIEDFINGLDPHAPKVDWTDLKNNVDRRNVAAK